MISSGIFNSIFLRSEKKTLDLLDEENECTTICIILSVRARYFQNLMVDPVKEAKSLLS